MIKPLKSTDQEEHAVLVDNQEELDSANHTCAVRNVGRKHGLIRASRALKSPEVSVACRHHTYLIVSAMIYDRLVCSAMTGIDQGKARIFPYPSIEFLSEENKESF